MNYLALNNKIKLLVAYNIGEVLDLLLNSIVPESEKVNEVILLIGRYNDINRDARLKRMVRNEISIEINKIRLSLLNFLTEATPEFFDYKKIEQALIHDDRFNKIIKRKIVDWDFRGATDSKQITTKTLVFDWENYFLNSTATELINVQNLIDTIHLFEAKFHLSLSKLEGLKPHKFSIALAKSVSQLRSQLSNKRIKWKVEYSSSPNNLRELIAYLNETIEIIIKS